MGIKETYPMTCDECLGYGRYDDKTGSPIFEGDNPDPEDIRECEFCGGQGVVYVAFDPETAVLSVPNLDGELNFVELTGDEAIKEVLFYLEENYMTKEQVYGIISAIKEREV